MYIEKKEFSNFWGIFFLVLYIFLCWYILEGKGIKMRLIRNIFFEEMRLKIYPIWVKSKGIIYLLLGSINSFLSKRNEKMVSFWPFFYRSSISFHYWRVLYFTLFYFRSQSIYLRSVKILKYLKQTKETWFTDACQVETRVFEYSSGYLF